MLGYDPMYLACEGRVVSVVDPSEAQSLLETWSKLEEGRDSAIIGRMDSGMQHVLMETEIGGERILEELEDDPLPRIC
jgi:hydrogenase expression/formation protein HypE